MAAVDNGDSRIGFIGNAYSTFDILPGNQSNNAEVMEGGMVQFLETLLTMVLNEWIEKNVTPQPSQTAEPDKPAGPQTKAKAKKRPR
eukprot:798722-Karenia_brevis.AAC.1